MRLVESQKAVRELDLILAYLRQNFSREAIQSLIKKYEKLLSTLTKFPNAYQKYPKAGQKYRCDVLDGLTIVYYTVSANQVIIQRIKDARSKPL